MLMMSLGTILQIWWCNRMGGRNSAEVRAPWTRTPPSSSHRGAPFLKRTMAHLLMPNSLKLWCSRRWCSNVKGRSPTHRPMGRPFFRTNLAEDRGASYLPASSSPPHRHCPHAHLPGPVLRLQVPPTEETVCMEGRGPTHHPKGRPFFRTSHAEAQGAGAGRYVGGLSGLPPCSSHDRAPRQQAWRHGPKIFAPAGANVFASEGHSKSGH